MPWSFRSTAVERWRCRERLRTLQTGGTGMVLNCPQWVCSLLVCGAILAQGCSNDFEYREIRTKNLVNEVSKALGTWLHDDKNWLSGLPAEAYDPDLLNSYFAQESVRRKYLSREVLQDRGNLDTDGGSNRLRLVDAWGRPLVFHVAGRYPAGLVYMTAEGSKTILPLPTSVWSYEERGQVQIWSLGRNGLDDRGQGDDILPSK